jgi:hypothetical protein
MCLKYPGLNRDLLLSFYVALRLSVRGGIQNIPDFCSHLYSSCGSAKHWSQQAKLWIPDFTATFGGDCVKTCEDVAPELWREQTWLSPWQRPVSRFRFHPAVYGEKQNGCHSPSTILPWFSTLWLVYISKSETETERTPVWCYWGIQADSNRVLDSLTEKASRKRSKNGRDAGTGVYMRERTTSRLMAADIFTASVRNIVDRPSKL